MPPIPHLAGFILTLLLGYLALVTLVGSSRQEAAMAMVVILTHIVADRVAAHGATA